MPLTFGGCCSPVPTFNSPHHRLSTLLPVHGEVGNVGKPFWPRSTPLCFGRAVKTVFLWFLLLATILSILSGISRYFPRIPSPNPEAPLSLQQVTSSFSLVSRDKVSQNSNDCDLNNNERKFLSKQETGDKQCQEHLSSVLSLDPDFYSSVLSI